MNRFSTLKAYFAWLDSMVSAGQIPQWTAPDSYSKFLCRFQLQHPEEAEVFWRGPGKGRYGMNPPSFDARFKAAMAPQGLWAARGLHNVPLLPDFDFAPLLEYAWDLGESDTTLPFSMNIAAAAGAFGTPVMRRHMALPVAHRLLGLPIPLAPWEWRKKGSRRKKPKVAPATEEDEKWRAVLKHHGVRTRTPKGVVRAIQRWGSAVLMVGRVPNTVWTWGGDSESGPLHEAEVHVPQGWTKSAPDLGVYVLSRASMPYPEATLAERQLFCLSWWDTVEPAEAYLDVADSWPFDDGSVYVYADACSTKGHYPLKRTRKVRKPPSGMTWYRVRAPRS